ncbi:MAG: (Fe-S)-binding protein [Flavonifractor plautii]
MWRESLRGQASHQGPAQGSAGLPQPFPLSWRGAGYRAEGQGATVLTCLRAGPGPGDGHQQTVAYPGAGVHLPGLHCGSCGAPSCRAFAEDVVLGRASEDDCIFKVRERMRSMAGSKEEADDYLPPPFRRRQEPSE